MGRSLAAVIAGFLVLGPLVALADTQACAPGRVDLRWQGGAASFRVELAETEDQREKGLMYRKSLPADAGMLFAYPAPRHVYYWMKDTWIPLDMIFVDGEGRVLGVHQMAQPMDRTPIDGGDGVAWVLEVNGGTARRLGIGPGAEMRGADMKGDLAWPCGAG